MGLTAEGKAARRTGITGTDAPTMFDMSRFHTRNDVFDRIVNGKESQAESEAMEVGAALEAGVALLFTKRTGKRLRPCMETMRHKNYPFLIGHPDYLVEDENAILEVKTTSEWLSDRWGEGEDAVPDDALCQGLHYCNVGDYARVYFAALIGGNRMKIYTVDRDDEAISLLESAELSFWRLHIETKTPPPMTGAELSRRWKSTTGKQVTAPGGIYDAVVRLKDLRRQLKHLESQDDELAAQIKQAIADNDELLYEGKKIASWRFNKSGMRFDLERFKTEQPEQYLKFMREAAGPRVLRLA